MFSLLCTYILIGLAATEVWVAPSTARILPDTRPSSSAETTVRLVMARGESESFQIVVRADRNGVDALDVEAAFDVDIPFAAHEIRSVEYLRDDAAPGGLVPDPLTPFAKASVAPSQTRALWVTYTPNESARPGTYTSTIRLRLGRRVTRDISVTLEVLGFVLPRIPSLSTLFSFDRGAIRRVYGMDDADLLRWQSTYDALAGYRIAYRLWDGRALAPPSSEGVVTENLKKHLAYVTAASAFAVVDLGPVETLAAAMPAPVQAEDRDPLVAYLSEMEEWLSARARGSRPLVVVSRPDRRSDWEGTRSLLQRLGKTSGSVQRLLVAPLHPYWESSVDSWAVTPDDYHPDGNSLLEQGRSLASIVSSSPVGIVGSSHSPMTMPDDACDGSLFSHWSPDPMERRHQLDIELEDSVTTGELRLAWLSGPTPRELKIRTSRNGRNFSTATIRWEVDEAQGSKGFTWWEGRLRVSKTFRAIRITFSGREDYRLAEVSFGATPVYPELRDGRRIQSWLRLDSEAISSKADETRTMGYRLMPWVCWEYGAKGFMGGNLSAWRRGYGPPAAGSTIWPSVSDKDFLIYPAGGAPAPSIRLMRLRDGMEDYEYLLALDTLRSRAERDGDVSTLGEVDELIASAPRVAERLDDATEDLEAEIVTWRVRAGRYLGAHSAR